MKIKVYQLLLSIVYSYGIWGFIYVKPFEHDPTESLLIFTTGTVFLITNSILALGISICFLYFFFKLLNKTIFTL